MGNPEEYRGHLLDMNVGVDYDNPGNWIAGILLDGSPGNASYEKNLPGDLTGDGVVRSARLLPHSTLVTDPAPMSMGPLISDSKHNIR